MEEIWKDVVGYEGYYEVSNLGNVRSVDREIVDSAGRVMLRKGKLKKQTVNDDGYLTVKLSKNGIDERVGVHRLVAIAFVSGYFEGAEVNHIDCNRSNNVYTNLEWITHANNVRYAIKQGNHVSCSDLSGSNNPNYGNDTLHLRYANDKEFAKAKQGRPGGRNGKARPIRAYFENGEYADFKFLGECADYLIESGIAKSKITNSVRWMITKSISRNKDYYGVTFAYID